MTTYTILKFGDAARAKILAGATQLSDAIRLTLGPRSRSVLIGQRWGAPIICDDGVTIAKRLTLKDPEENLGAQMLREAAVKTGDAVGDGTSTATILAHALFADGLRNVVAGASATELRAGMMEGSLAVQEALKSAARPVETRLEKVQVATVSAHGDASIGELVADAIERVGSEGVVSVEEAKSIETTVDLVEGMRFDRGFLSPYFVTSTEKMEAVLDKPYVLLTDEKISSIKDLVPLLELVSQAGRPLLVVAEDVSGEALATLVVNKLRGVFTSVAVKAPGFGDRRRAMLHDLAILTGGQVATGELGIRLENVTLDQLGRADRVVIDGETTTVVGGGGAPEAIRGRCEELRRLIEGASSDYDRAKLQERLAKLSGGVAVISVGAATEAEMKSKKEAVDDAISATQAAVAEGIVVGGGVALARAGEATVRLDQELEGDRLTGARILRRAMQVPLRQIAGNSGFDPGVVVDRVLAGEASFGFDAAAGRYVDLVTAGILDPHKVVRVALENAVSVAATLLLADATMTEIQEDGEPDAPAPEF